MNEKEKIISHYDEYQEKLINIKDSIDLIFKDFPSAKLGFLQAIYVHACISAGIDRESYNMQSHLAWDKANQIEKEVREKYDGKHE